MSNDPIILLLSLRLGFSKNVDVLHGFANANNPINLELGIFLH